MCFVLATTPAGGLRGIDFNRDFEHGKTHTACDAEQKLSCFASSPPNRTFVIKCITTWVTCLEGPPNEPRPTRHTLYPHVCVGPLLHSVHAKVVTIRNASIRSITFAFAARGAQAQKDMLGQGLKTRVIVSVTGHGDFSLLVNGVW